MRVLKKGSARQTTAWILSAAMVFSACPTFQSQAEETQSEEVTAQEEVVTESATESAATEMTEGEAAETEEAETEEAATTEETAAAEETVSESESTESASTEIETETETAESETTESSEDGIMLLSDLEEEPVALSDSIGNVTKTCPTIGENGAVTFHYYPSDSETVTNAYVKGSWDTSWNTFYYMSEGDDGVWSVTVDLGLDQSYEYGIMVNDNWVGDATNPSANGNSKILRNPVANNDGSVSIYYYPQGDESVTLLYKETDMDEYQRLTMTADATYSALLSATISEQGDYTYCFEVDGTQTQDMNCTEAAFSITKLPEDDASVESPVVNGNEVTFNYFAPTAKSVNLAGSMNSWNTSADSMTYNEDTGFWSITKTLEDGEYQYKFVVDGSSWVTDPRNDEYRSGNSYLYVGADDVEQEERYVIVEYTRDNGDYDGWNIYSWDTGYASEVTIDFQEIDGKMVAMIPVVETNTKVSFCMRRSEDGNEWAEKDGGDHYVSIPTDQQVVKAQFVQGSGVVGNLPYNIGYETNVADGEITFYYRDDTLYAQYEEDTLQGSVTLVWDGAEYPMAYDETNERYYYTGVLTAGEHYYGYLVNGELTADRFNSETAEIDGVTYSAYTYTIIDAQLTATVTPSEIDYNDNAVLKLTLDSEDVTPVEAYADLSALGMSSSFAIDPTLMEGTIAVTDTTSTGVKEIPITVKDQYGNLYTTTAQVTVKARESGDFDWDEAVIYFTVTDRFFDGDSSNNDAYGTGTYDTSMGSMYHGGDFAGLEAKLDYLQELGVNTVWITPIVENIEDVMTCDGYDGQLTSGYHGYWASDFTSLNKHLGTEEELQELIDALHARGMKLMVDVVLNHAGYNTEDNFNNTYIAGKNMLRDDTTTVSGDTQKDGLSGLPDFVTEDSEVRDLLIAWQSAWVSKYDIDYFRVDTVKHVDDTTWKAFKNALTEINPDFKMIGEYSGAGYATSAGQLGTGQMDSLLDFDFNDQAISFVSGSLSSVESFLESRNSSLNNTATVGSFLGSHDEDGLMYRLMNEKGYDSDAAYALMKVAATLQITAKGQPVIYYGEELGQTGANNWPYQENRYDMDWSLANDDNDMLAHYSKLLEIRNDYTDVFAKGTRSTVAANDADGTLVAARTYGDETLYVGFNVNENDAKSVTLTLAGNTTYTDLYNGTVYRTQADGTLVLTIPAASEGGTAILVAGEAVTPAEPETPGNDTNDDSSDNNSTGTTTTSSSNTTASEGGSSPSQTVAAAVVRPVEPTYTALDGTVAVGWAAVTEAALADVQSELVPLAAGVEAALGQTPIVNLTLAANTNMVIPYATVQKMAASNAIYVFAMADGVITAYTSAALSEVTGDLDLTVSTTDTKDFGQGFRSLIVEPRKKAIYGNKLATVVTVGAQNAGKVAYVFQRNLGSDTVELLDCVTIDAAGQIAVSGVDYTDFIILYQ